MLTDLALLVVFVAVVGVCFWSGMIRSIIALVAFYASVVLASLYFKFASVFVTRRGIEDRVADVLSFVTVLVVAFAILAALSVYTFRYVRLPGQLEFFDRLLGAAVGMVLAVAVLTTIAMLLHYTFIAGSTGNQGGIAGLLRRVTQASSLVPILTSNLLPRLFRVVSPFVPDAALPLFQP
jgi:uncharacterized membrane protein required for colicin V production